MRKEADEISGRAGLIIQAKDLTGFAELCGEGQGLQARHIHD